jgi:sec-independent protein translocase protein TatB
VFDVAFSELIVIAVVALIVIGPEKLPKVARTLGALTGRMQRYVAQVKEEVNREVRFQELQQLQKEIQETATKTQTNLQQKADAMLQDLHSSHTESEIDSALDSGRIINQNPADKNPADTKPS